MMSSLSLLPVELQQVSCRLASRQSVLRRYATYKPQRGPRLSRWRTVCSSRIAQNALISLQAPFDPDALHEAARPSNPMYYRWSKRADAALRRMFRFTVIGFGLAAIITPSIYGGAYAWTAFKEIAPLHRAIAEDVDPEADRFRWALDSSLAFGGAHLHQATDPSMPFSARLHAIATAIALYVAGTDESDAPLPVRLDFEGVTPFISLPRGYATAVANLQKSLQLCRNMGLELPHAGVLELERNLADALDASASVEAAKAGLLQYERILYRLLAVATADETFDLCEVVRSARRAGEIAQRLSQQQLVDPVSQEAFRQRAVRHLSTAIKLSLADTLLPLPATRIRHWWWPLRWLIPVQDAQEASLSRSQIAVQLEHSTTNVEPSLARSVVISAGLLSALSAQTGHIEDAEAIIRSAMDFVQRHEASICTDLVLAESPSASLHAHWLNVHYAMLQRNLAELVSIRSNEEALEWVTDASLQAESEAIALRARFPALLHSRTRKQKLLSGDGDALEPLRRPVQDTIAAADNAGISSQMLCGALYELQGRYDDALQAYDRAKVVSAGADADCAIALADEAFLGAGMQKGAALYDLQWEQANLCARRARAKLAKSRGEAAPALPPAQPERLPLRGRLPIKWQQNETAVALADFLQDQYDDARALLKT